MMNKPVYRFSRPIFFAKRNGNYLYTITPFCGSFTKRESEEENFILPPNCCKIYMNVM